MTDRILSPEGTRLDVRTWDRPRCPRCGILLTDTDLAGGLCMTVDGCGSLIGDIRPNR